MPRDSGGAYTLPAGNPVVSGTIIASTWANTTMDDLASAMTDSLSRTGNGTMQAPLKLMQGSESNPSLTFGADPLTGRYLAAAGDMRDTVSATDLVKYTAAAMEVIGAFTLTGARIRVDDQTNVNAADIVLLQSEGGARLYSNDGDTFLATVDNVASGNQIALAANRDAGVELYFNGIKGLETTASGVLIPNNRALQGRNVADTTNHVIAKIETDDDITIASISSPTTRIQSLTEIRLNVNSQNIGLITVDDFAITKRLVMTLEGILLPHTEFLSSVDNAGTGEYDLIGTTGTEMIVGQSTGPTAIVYRAQTQHRFVTNATQQFEIISSGVNVTGIATSTLQPTAASHLTRKDYVDGVSDVTWKENINPLENAIETVNKWAIKKFDWKEDAPRSGSGVGPIAQELEKVSPELVRTDDYKHLDRDSIIGYLIKSVQELSAEVELLKAN